MNNKEGDYLMSTDRKKIYFADLTYHTDILSCDYMPLGCGYVAAYAKELFGTKCDINIFKYTDKLLKAIKIEPPDIFAGSCYVWNKNLTLMVSQFINEKNPDCLIVLGGLAFPLDIKRQKEFLLKNRQIDFFVPYDGELGFANLLEKYLNVQGDREKLKDSPIDGCIYLNNKDEIIIGKYIKRPNNLDIFPSPYLTGLFNEFFEDGKFTPMIQTTRGCPFRCSYCWASNEQNRNISFFSIERVKSELNYIAELAASRKNIYDLSICDSNFGLYKKDCQIIDAVYELQQKYNYPMVFTAPYGEKNRTEYIEHLSKLKGVTYCYSTQSTDPKILENVKRKNVDLRKISEYVKTVHGLGKHIHTEIITGLPFETKDIHMNTIRDLLDCGFDCIEPFTFMLLDGIQLDSEEAHRRFKYDIRYRLIPRNFGRINERYSFEIERVVVGTDTYNFEDYIYLRSFHGFLRLLLNNDVYRELLQYIKQNGIHLLDWFIFVFDDLRDNTSKASKCFQLYINEACSELYKSPEELITYFSKKENYRKLLRREYGENLLQKYTILASSIYFNTYVNYFFKMASSYLGNKYPEKKSNIKNELSDIKKFILARLSGVLKKDIQKIRFFKANYDILRWIDDGFKESLSNYKLKKSKLITLELSNEQIRLIKNIFRRYNVKENNPYGLYKTTAIVRINNYYRKVTPHTHPVLATSC